MAVSLSGNITQSPSGTTLVFTDTSTGLTGVTSRVLNLYDPNGVNITTINMGTGVTAEWNITADQWISFVETIVSNEGTNTLVLHYLSTAFYENTFANAMVGQTCPNGDYYGVFFNLNRSQDFYQAALRFFIGGFGISAQAMITQANFYVATPYYSQ